MAHSSTETQVDQAAQAPRSRRALLTAAAGAAAAVAAQAVVSAAPVSAAQGGTAKIGQTNTGTSVTSFKNTSASGSEGALAGKYPYTGSGGTAFGVKGQCQADDGNGVVGLANHGNAAYGVGGYATQGVGGYFSGGAYGSQHYGGAYGAWAYGNTAGVYGYSGAYGVYGVSTNASGYGVYGVGSNASSYGVLGTAPLVGVYGSSAYTGGWFAGTSSSATNYGVVGDINDTGGGYAGWFYGNVEVTGAVTFSVAATAIDHPLAPELRVLSHALVGSPEMLNVYSGTVTLGARGTATVRLPAYYQALNGSHRYQLTAIGAAAPNLHVASEIEGNRFRIAGGTPGQKVSWQVTGVRQDAHARAHRVRAVQAKPAAGRGKYLSPKAFGKPRSARMGPAAPRAQRAAAVQRPQAKARPTED